MKQLIVNKTNTHLIRTKLNLIQYKSLFKKLHVNWIFYKLDKKESSYWFLTKSYQGPKELEPSAAAWQEGTLGLTEMLPSPKRLTAHGGGIF